MSQTPLSTQLFRRLLLLLALSGIASIAILFFVSDHAIRRASDGQLVNAAELLHMMMQDELAAGALIRLGRDDPTHGADELLTNEDRNAFEASYNWCMFMVLWKGKPIAQLNWTGPVNPIPHREGLHTFRANGKTWRSFVLADRDRRLHIVVAERESVRDNAIFSALRQIIVPLLALLALAVFVLWRTLRKSLFVIEHLARTLNGRTLADLAPLAPTDWSRDLHPLIEALNKLFDRLDRAYEREQAFTDDVAHQLRTPLATIRMQAQVIRRTVHRHAHEPQAQECGAQCTTLSDIDRLIAAVDRANDLVDGMLVLARLEVTKASRRQLDVHALVAEVVAETILELPADAMMVAVRPDHPVEWKCDGTSLRIALEAIVGNAVHHAGAGGSIDIAITSRGEWLDIAIGDRGPGIAPAQRTRMLKRFERGTSEVPGSGLGLSIATKAMNLMGGQLHLEARAEGPGLLVRLSLPA